MSHEGYGYRHPYSSLPPRQRVSHTAQSTFGTSNAPSSGPYYGSQATASPSTADSGGLDDYQAQRYNQHRLSNAVTGNNHWYWQQQVRGSTGSEVSNGVNNLESTSQQSHGDGRSGQQISDSSGLGSLAYASTLDYAQSHHAEMQLNEEATSGANDYRNWTGSQPSAPQLSYQVSSTQSHGSGHSAANTVMTNAGATGTTINRGLTPVAPVTKKNPGYTLPSPTTAYPQALTNSYPRSFNATVPKNIASTTSRNTETSESYVPPPATYSRIQYSKGHTRSTSFQIARDQRRQHTATPPARAVPKERSAVPVQNAAIYAQSTPAIQSSKSPVLNDQGKPIHQRKASQPTQSTKQVRPTDSSRIVPPQRGTSQGQRHPISQTEVIQQGKSSNASYPPQDHAVQGSNSTNTSAPQKPPSPPRPTFVDLSQVYNRFHEYQKQIEAADVEHARLVAIKANREAEEAARAAKALASLPQSSSAKALSPGMSLSQLQLLREEIASPRAPASVTSIATATFPAANAHPEVNRSSQGAAPVPGVKDPAAAAMEEEMRRMVEKMREYQAQDPNLFSQVWESVKKGQVAPATTNNTGTTAPQQSEPAVLNPKSPIDGQVFNGGATVENPVIVPSKRKRKPRQKKQQPDGPLENQGGLAETPVSAPSASGRSPKAHPSISSPIKAYKEKPVPVSGASSRQVQGGATSPKVARETPIFPPSSFSQQIQRRQIPIDPALLKTPLGSPAGPSAANSDFPIQNPPSSATLATSSPITHPTALQNAHQGPPSILKNKTLWPEPLKDSLSTAAAGVLIENPKNQGKEITAKQIRTMLDLNPSYFELCALIEDLGFTIDRSSFAKTLLGGLSHTNTHAPPPLEQSTLNVQLDPRMENGTPKRLDTNEDQTFMERRPRGRPKKDGQPPVKRTCLDVQFLPYDPKTGQAGRNHLMDSTQDEGPRQGWPPGAGAGAVPQGNHVSSGHESAAPLSGVNGYDQTAMSESIPIPVTKEMAARKRTLAELMGGTDENYPTLWSQKLNGVGMTEAAASHYGDQKLPEMQLSRTTSPHLALVPKEQPSQPSHNLTHDHSVTATTGIAAPASTFQPVTNPFEGLDVVKPIEQSLAAQTERYNPKTIARDVLIAAGCHPTQRALNAHLESLKAGFSKLGDSSNLSTFRWDIVDPGGLPVGSANMTEPQDDLKPPQSEQKSPFSHTSTESFELALRRSSTPSRIFGEGSTLPIQASKLRNSSTFAVVVPMTIRNTAAYTLIESDDQSEQDGSDSHSNVKRRGRPPKDRSHQPVQEPKKRGRPSFADVSARRQREKPPVAGPKFAPFSCEWVDCKAELHNLETLRKHVHVVHAKKESLKHIICQWGNCRTAEESIKFDTVEDLRNHLERSHLVTFAWHKGDGPRASVVDSEESDASAYLSDANGRVVTPSVIGQQIEYGNAYVNNWKRHKQAQRAAIANGSKDAKARGRLRKVASAEAGSNPDAYEEHQPRNSIFGELRLKSTEEMEMEE